MSKYTLINTKQSYLAAWENMVIKPEILPKAQAKAAQIVALKDRYAPLEAITGVPWYFIGLLHMRESNLDFETHLHNGDPLNENGRYVRTTHVPAKRPVAPPKNGKTYTFEESAIDALTYEFGKVKEWDIAQIAFLQETYNGFGYRNKGRPSPYLWSGSNQYSKGKYIKDGIYDPTVVDSQLGVMVVLKCILEKTEPLPVIEHKEEKSVPISPAADVEKPTSKELRKTSRKFALLEWVRHFFGWTTGITATGATLSVQNIQATRNFFDVVKSFGAEYGVFIVIALLVLGFIATHFLMEWMKQDVEQGRYAPSGDAK